MGPGKRVTVARVASRYSVLWLPEDLGSQTGSGFLIGLPWDRIAATFILPVHEYTVMCLQVHHLPEIRYDITSRATAVGG